MNIQSRDQIKKYYDLLKKWNSKINLMSVSDEDEFIDKHVEDAHALIAHLKDVESLVDLGAGAGVPGIIIKIERPSIDVTLVEATRKKVSFCEEAIRSLNLENIRAIWGNAEDEGLMKGLGAFDVSVSRATWDLETFVPIGSKYIDIDGRCIAMKGSSWRAELEKAEDVIDDSGLVHERDVEYVLKGGEKRCLVIFRKDQNV